MLTQAILTGLCLQLGLFVGKNRVLVPAVLFFFFFSFSITGWPFDQKPCGTTDIGLSTKPQEAVPTEAFDLRFSGGDYQGAREEILEMASFP